ncbi:MAG: hypothetical protein K2L70_01835 [Clostridia bacterium]|nr:hypothetical protein [Clostridia bacterium]
MAENEEKNINVEDAQVNEAVETASDGVVIDCNAPEAEYADAVVVDSDVVIADEGVAVDGENGAAAMENIVVEQAEYCEGQPNFQFNENDALNFYDGQVEGYPDGQFDNFAFENMPPQEQVVENNRKPSKQSKVRVIKKLNIEKDKNAIARQRRNKIIGKVLACVFVFIFLGTIAGITAGAYTAADKLWMENVGEEAGVEFKELFTLFNGVVDSNEDKIVTKGFNQQDLEEFYSNLKRKMFLAQDYNLSIGQIISSVMSASGEEQESQQSYTTIGVDGYDLQYVYLDADGNTVTSDEKPTADDLGESEGNQDETNSSLTGNEQLDQLLQELKFDFSSLAQYEGERNILEISDKQLAAVINDAFSELATSFGELEEIEKSIGKSINEVIAIKQVIISGNELTATDTNLKLTLEVKAKDLLSNLLTQYGIPSIVNAILPEKLYASVRVYPYDVTKPIEASINRLEEEKVNKIVRIIDVILKKSGNTTSISDLLVQVNGKVVEVLDKAQQKLPITFVPTGSVDLYPIESLMGMLDVDVSEQAFLYMLKDIKLPTGETLGLVMPTPEEIKKKTSVFVSELSVKYCLDNSDGKISQDNTIKDVMNFASSDNALEAIHLKEMDYSGIYSQHLKVRTSYDALAGMLSDYVKNEGLLQDIVADIVKMSYTSSGEILSIDIRINLSQMLGYDDDSVMSSLIKQLVPEYIYVSANICANANKNVPTEIEINKTGSENSKAHLQTLTALAGKFGMDTSSLTYDDICAKVDEGLKSGLSQMQEKIGCEILFTDECAYLPDLFEVVCGTGLLNEDEEHKIEPEKLYNIMKQTYTYEVASADINKTANADGFIGELEGKYYLQEGKIVDDGEGNLLHSVMGLKENFGSSIDKSALADDDRDISAINPKMTAGEFAYLMELNIDMNNMSEALKSAEVLGARINDDEIILYLQAKLYETQENVQADVDSPQEDGNAPEEDEEVDLSKYSNLLPQLAYVTVIIDAPKMTSGSEENSVKIIIDGMEDDDMSDFFSIVRKLTGKSMTEGEIEDKIDVQVKDYMSNVKGIDYKFAGGALTLDNIFNVMANSDIIKSQNPDDYVFKPEEIRRLLKQLYGYDYDAVSGGNFTPASNLDNFIDVELYDKYFISDGFKDTLKESEKDDTLLDGFAGIGGDNFSVDKIRLRDVLREDGSIIYGLTSLNNLTDRSNKSQVQIDQEIAQNFKPKFSREELAHLLRTHVSSAGNMSFMTEQEVVFADNDENIMTLTLRGRDNLEDENAKGLMPDYFYVNVTIELGYISEIDGTRSDMNVYAMDINSVRYVEDKGENQDLQLLLMLIDRIQNNSNESQEPAEEVSLDGIMQDIEQNLKEFKAQIHNNVFTVSFLAEGGLMFNETVYQIALNSVYGASANEYGKQDDMPDEIDFRNGLCKVNNMPDKFEYEQGVFIDFANGNRADNSNKAIADINDKYALAKPLQDGTTAILSILGEYAKDYATNIDGQLLTSQQKRNMSVEQLRPIIDGEELLLMLENSVTFSADGYQNAVMKAMYILDDKMLIVYNSPVEIEQENDKFVELLPDTMSMVVNIDVDALDEKDRLCTQISINDLLDCEVNAIQSMVYTLNQKEGKESKSLEEANVECSDSVRETMKSLTDNMTVRYVADDTVDGVTGGGAMILDSIYEVSAKKINEVDNEGEVAPQEVKDTLEALFDGLDIEAYTPPAGLSADDMKITYTRDKENERSSNLMLDTSNILNRSLNISGAIGGWNIASMIDTDRLLGPLGLEDSAQDGVEVLKLKHTALVPKKVNGDGTFDDIREKLGSLLDKEYFLITLDMDMVAAAGMEMSILPKRMDLTLYMDLTSEEISIIYNAMSDRQRGILSRLVKTSRPEGVGGLDLSNTDAVKSEIMDMEIIREDVGSYTFTVTLGDLLHSGGIVLPISKALEQVERDNNIILGMGAMVVDYTVQI